jgi:hypothetical protein
MPEVELRQYQASSLKTKTHYKRRNISAAIDDPSMFDMGRNSNSHVCSECDVLS